MSRERLTSRVAEDMKAKPGAQVEAKGNGIDNDVYDMNDTGHAKNDPKVDQYAKGEPSAWAEDKAPQDWPSQDKGGEKRNDMNVADLQDKHAATEAVATVKALEKKAVKCMVASQRMLPGAADDLIVKQAIDLMNLPEEAINATLARQETLAYSMKLATEAKKPEVCKEDEEKEAAAKKIMDEKMKKLEAMKKEAAELEKEITAGQNDPKAFDGKGQKVKDVEATDKKEEEEACDKEAAKDVKKEEGEEVEAAKKDKKEEDGEEVEAAKDVKKEEGEEVEAAKKDKKEEDETEKEASLLDTIFSDVIASDNKKGATKLSGIVKKEASSDSGDALSKLWNSAPDVGGLFQ